MTNALDGLQYDPQKDTFWGAALSAHIPVLISDQTNQRPLTYRHAKSWLVIPLLLPGEVVGIVTAESTEPNAFSGDMIAQANELAQWFAVAVGNQRQLTDQKAMTDVLIQVHETERERLADVLHDDIADGLSLLLKSLRRELRSTSTATSEAMAPDIAILEDITRQARLVSHSLGAKRILAQFDLVSALEILFDNYARQTDISVAFMHPPIEDIVGVPNSVALVIYRIAQESLANVAKHTQVEEIVFTLEGDSGRLYVTIEDNGPGFDTKATLGGIGLIGMVQRAASIGGELNVQSSPGNGTCIRFWVPVPSNGNPEPNLPDEERQVNNLSAFARL
ncbi:MAG: ATP-binding protein, partial [Chloroflexota bacterium]